MKISILTKAEYRSPRILGESLKEQLKEAGIHAEIFFEINVLTRHVNYRNSKLSFHFWLGEKIKHYYRDRKILRALQGFDAIVISECIPNGYCKDLYNIEKLKCLLKKPVFIYEVYSLENAPTQKNSLKKNNGDLYEKYNGHLSVSPVTEIRNIKQPNIFCIGLFAKTWNLHPLPKKELIALIDFAQPGFEKYREIQIDFLKKAGVSYISLEKEYSVNDIRDIYRTASIYFMQSYEAFGLPILECLCTGAQIFTPDSAWPMSWRLNDKPEVHGKGLLPDCFTIYNENNLLEKLLSFKENYDTVSTPLSVFNIFIKHYPDFYGGNRSELNRFVDYISTRSS